MASRPTPYSISLSALIALHCQDGSPLYAGNDDPGGYKHVEMFLKDTLFGRESSDWSALYAPSIASLLSALSEVSTPDLVSGFSDWLTVTSTSLDAFMDLMTTLQRTVQDGSVDAESSLGIFLRSVSLGFEELSFESTVQLWNEFCRQIRNDEGDATQEEWTLSAEQLESALNEECVALAQRPNPMPLHHVQLQLQRILDHNPELPSAHFLKFLHCLHAGERVGAVEALHQYLDAALIQHADEILQFSSILKAALHHDMGDAALSEAATQEAVRVAQQSQDAASVAFALGWLSVHSPTDPSLIQRCAQRASEGQLRSLAAGASLSLAMRTDWSRWMDASTDPPSAEVTRPWERSTHLQHLASAEQSQDILARQGLVAAGIWDAVGHTALSGLESQTALQRPLTAQQTGTAIANLVRVVVCGDPLEGCICIYGEALAQLVNLRQEYGFSASVFSFEVAILLHEWAVRRDDFLHAENLLATMKSHLCPRTPNYDAVEKDILMQECLLLTRQERFDDAVALCKTIIAKSPKDARVWLLITIIQLESHPLQFASALPSMMQCLAHTGQNQSLHAAALSVLAMIHLRRGHTDRALSVLEACLPVLLEHEHVWLQGQAYLTLSLCYLKRSSTAESSFVDFELAKEELTRSQELFLLCQDRLRLKQVNFFLAKIYNKLGQTKERDSSAQECLRLSKPTEHQVEVVGCLGCHKELLKLARRTITVL